MQQRDDSVLVTRPSCAAATIAAPGSTARNAMDAFWKELAAQRLDDHRYYHRSRINQSLHLVSAVAFVVAYGLLFVDPAWAAIVGWCVSMVTRQAGHFFFEPRGWDDLNQVSDEYKESVKVGYNIRRKIVLMGAWVAVPVVLALWPSLGGLIQPARDLHEAVHDVGLAWLALGAAGLALRVGQLWLRDGAVTALAWLTKILTDPFNDIVLYRGAPLALLRGERIDPMPHVRPH
jgi:hypothetical protein